MTDIMLDLETMGTSPTSAIVSIGAVKFSPEGGVTDDFYARIHLPDAVDSGLTLDPAT